MLRVVSLKLPQRISTGALYGFFTGAGGDLVSELSFAMGHPETGAVKNLRRRVTKAKGLTLQNRGSSRRSRHAQLWSAWWVSSRRSSWSAIRLSRMVLMAAVNATP